MVTFDELYMSSLRSLVRRIRVVHWALKAYQNFFRFLYWMEYLVTRPTTTILKAGPVQGKFVIESFPEFARIRASGSERHLLGRFVGILRSGDVVYDVGASIGHYTIPAALAVGDGQVISFEPEPQSRDRLLQNLALNGLGNVKVFDKGLGDAPGEGKLVCTGGSFVSGAHGFFYPHTSRGAGVYDPDIETIEIVPGDVFIAEMNLPLPNAVKIDVEGFEYEVLTGLRETLSKTQRCTVLVEVHFSVLEKRGMTDAPRKIRKLLEEASFAKFEWLDYSHLLASKL